MLNFLAYLKSKILRPSALNESSDIIVEISARDITQDWSALALVSVETQTRNYSLPQRMKWARQSKQKHLEGKELGCSHRANQSLAVFKVSWVLWLIFFLLINTRVIWNGIHNVRNPPFISDYRATAGNTLSAISRDLTDLLRSVTPITCPSSFAYPVI